VTVSTGDDGPRYYPQSGPAGGYQPYQPPRPDMSEPDQYAYSPYQPGAFEPAPPTLRRPGTVIGALVVLVLSALPFLVFGVAGLFVPITQDMFPPELGLDALLTQYNVSFAEFLQAVRLIVGLVAVLALAYIGCAVAAFLGSRGGRIGVTVLTVIFVGFLLLNVVGAGSATAVVLVPALLAVLGVVLLFLRPSADWFASRR
jgi:hypothetical protein